MYSEFQKNAVKNVKKGTHYMAGFRMTTLSLRSSLNLDKHTQKNIQLTVD